MMVPSDFFTGCDVGCYLDLLRRAPLLQSDNTTVFPILKNCPTSEDMPPKPRSVLLWLSQKSGSASKGKDALLISLDSWFILGNRLQKSTHKGLKRPLEESELESKTLKA